MHHTHAYALLRMAEHDLELGVAGTASSGAEADLMCQRLAEKQQLERAREILAAPSDISEDELATMAEVAPVPVAPPRRPTGRPRSRPRSGAFGIECWAGLGVRANSADALCATQAIALRSTQVPDSEPPDDQDQSPAEQGPNIMMPPEEFAGKWANAASIARTPHEFTLDFMRIGPQGQQGMVVSRVSFSPLLASQLLDLLGEQWQAYTEESGIPPEGEGDE